MASITMVSLIITLANSIYPNDTHKKICVLLNSVQEFIEIEAWLLLTFFLCLHNQLYFIHSIVTYFNIFEKCNS